MFYKFIWNGGNDRVQRKLMCNDFGQCGLRMVDPCSSSENDLGKTFVLDDGFNSIHVENN